ncbi:MAG: sugar phosphate nucleotidyltransferase [bacterium]|nr:sugar phosphate nucleotidyltransferase [bacterium]
MKALVLAAGRGKRLQENSANQNKCLINIKGQPLIECSFENALAAEVKEIVVVVGYRAEDIISQYGNSYQGKPVKYAIQNEQAGLVHAIACSQRVLGGSDFMLMLGDELMLNPRHKEFMAKFQKENLFGLCGVVKVKDKSLIKKTYALAQDKNGVISRLIEKPDHPKNNIMGTGNCIFKHKIFDYIEKTPLNQIRGEKELPDLIQAAIDDGQLVKSFSICDEYINVNVPEEIDRANSYFRHY